MGLRDLAVLAATFEDLVHGEAIQNLKAAFDAQKISVDEVLSEVMEQRVVNTYMLFHVKPHPNYTKMSPSRLNHVISKASSFLPGWNDTLLWVQDIKQSMEYDQLSVKNPFNSAAAWHTFDGVAKLVEEVGEKYGQYQNVECHALKNALLDLEDNENGRVRLSRFYAPALDGTKRHFGESPDYLRHLGALDETDPTHPSILVTNYLYARSNCLAASGFYSVCCINQCEALLARLEGSLHGPAAPVQTLLDQVSMLSSETIIGPRNLSSTMRARLADIGQRHGGDIPIHGRLFAQWMHHAFPNECPYPHSSGALDAPLSAAQWRASVGKASARASKDDMQFFVDAAALPEASESGALETIALPWTEEEELLTPLAARGSAWSVASGLRCVVLVMAMASAAVGTLRLARAPSATLPLFAGKGKPATSWAFGLPQVQKTHLV